MGSHMMGWRVYLQEINSPTLTRAHGLSVIARDSVRTGS